MTTSKTSTIALEPPFFVTALSIPKDWGKNSAIECLDPSLTVQADRESADINFIVKQFGITGRLPYGVAVPEYADYSDIPNDYHLCRQFIDDLDDSFLEMPAPVRARFDNDPGLFLDFVNASENYDEAISLGLVPKKPDLVAAGDKSVNVVDGSAHSPT